MSMDGRQLVGQMVWYQWLSVHPVACQHVDRLHLYWRKTCLKVDFVEAVPQDGIVVFPELGKQSVSELPQQGEGEFLIVDQRAS